MKKRILSLILMLVLAANLLPLSSCGGQDKDEVMTRGEWIMLLGDTMGMTDYANPAPYFSDVDAEAKEFPYVQSCKEWGTLKFETDALFRPDDAATKEFMAVTAALASGAIDTERVSAPDTLAYAVQIGLIENKKGLSDNIVLSEAKKAAATTAQTYLSHAEADAVEIDFADGVVDLSASNDVYVVDEFTVTAPAAVTEMLGNGSVLIAPGNAMDPFGIAMKVTGITIQGDYAVIQTVEPELEEIFDSYKVYGSGVPELDGLQLADGVTMGSSVTTLKGTMTSTSQVIDNLLYSGNISSTEQADKGISLSFNINFTKGTISVAPEWENRKVTVERLIPYELRECGDIGMSPGDDLGEIFEKTNYNMATIPLGTDENGNPYLDCDGIEQVLTVSNKFSGGYEITGGISLNNVYVQSGFEFKKIIGIPVGIERAVVQINSEAVVTGNLKGVLSEELTIGSLPVPIAGGLSVKMDLILYADVCGELGFRVEVKNNTKFEYNKGNLKRVTTKEGSTSVEAAVNIEMGVAPTAILRVLGIDIIDIKVKAGVDGKSSAVLQYGQTAKTMADEDSTVLAHTLWGQLVLETEVSLPVITLEVGTKETLANQLNISGEWTLISDEGAPIKWRPSLLNHKWTLFEVDVLLPMDTDTGFGNKADSDFWWASDLSRLDLKEYSVILSLNDSPYQLELDLHGANEIPEVTWASNDTAVVEVDKNGRVTPRGEGFATVTVSLKHDPDVYVKCTVFVDGCSENGWEFLPADMVYSV